MKNKIERERLDVDRKVVALFIFGIICSILLILVVNLSVNTSSGIRAYVAGEAIWAKSQKEAIIHLSQYIVTEDNEDYHNFNDVLQIIYGDRKAREELKKESFNYDIVFEGYAQGLNHPEDIPHMINVFKRFQDFSHVKHAVEVWETADQKIDELVVFAQDINRQISNREVDLEQKKSWLRRLNRFDHELTAYELEFSKSMGNMARLVNNLLRWSTIILGLIVISIAIWLVMRFLNSTKKWARTIKESEERFKNVLNNSRDVLYKMDIQTKQYEYISPAVKQMLGYDPTSLLNGGVEFIIAQTHPDDKKEMKAIVNDYEEVSDHDFLPTLRFRIKDASGDWKWVSNARTLIRNEAGEPTSIVGSVRDISTQKKQEQQIKQSLEEKELLLQEIHHRVKNNLSIISSLLELQKDGVPQGVKDTLSESQLRIKSIAKVHERLYKSTNLSDTPLDEYISELTAEIKNTYQSSKQSIDIRTDIENISVTINDAIPLGLIINELINNAFKHAFDGLEKGTLIISLQSVETGLQMIVKNDGHQLDEEIDFSNNDSLGMTLIEVLVKRINGTLEVSQEGEWTQFVINFSIEE